MNERNFSAGRAMEQRMLREGRFTAGTVDNEALAPKTWILWKNTARGEEICTIESEIHKAPSQSEAGRMCAMLVTQCPVCWREFQQQNYIHVHEENKQLSLDWVQYSKLPTSNHLSINWRWHCKNVLHREPRSDDKIAVVSSPERWMCDYCKSWCVRVTDSIAITDLSGATVLVVDQKSTHG